MTNSTMFQEAVEAIENGELERARDLLVRLLKIEKENPTYWLWMSSVVNSKKERVYCLENVLKFDETNELAKLGLTLEGQLPAGDHKSVTPLRRTWDVGLDHPEESITGSRRPFSSTRLSILIMGFFIVIVGLISSGIYHSQGIFKPRLTITPIAWTDTPTRPSAHTQKTRTPTPTPFHTSTPEPLWMLLEATYTPVPLYISTPHPRLESYRLALRAYERADYEEMISFLEQTLLSEPNSPDLIFLIGEGYRLLGMNERAIEKYEETLNINPRFAPVYLSLSIVKKTIYPGYDVLNDLNKALEFDPQYLDAYIDRAIYYSENGDFEAALSDLGTAERIMTDNPEVQMELSKLYLKIGNKDQALEHAIQAYSIDITLLPNYLVLAQAYLENQMPVEAMNKLNVFGLYLPNDPDYLTLLGGTLFEIGDDYDLALEVLEKVIYDGDDNSLAYYYHGLVSLAQGNSKQAVNDLYLARTIEPRNFNFCIWFGIALFQDNRYDDSFGQMGTCEDFIRNEDDFVLFNYYRGKSGLALGQYHTVDKSWGKLIEMPEELIPESWLGEIDQYFNPPTETPTVASTPSVTRTSSASSPTQTPTISLTPSQTLMPDLTPFTYP